MARPHYVAIKSLGKLRSYFKIIHQCTCICGCESSSLVNGKHVRQNGMGLLVS